MNIGRIRRHAGLTQVRLARLLGVHPITVSKWERGLLAPNAHQSALLRALDSGTSADGTPPGTADGTAAGTAAGTAPGTARGTAFGTAPRTSAVLDLAEELAGHLNRAFIEATEIDGMQLSASNLLKGKIVQLDEGPVSTRVVLQVAPRVRLTSTITTASARRLKLRVGARVTAIVKASDVILGVA